MTASDDLPLAADFAPATQDAWRKLVDGVLKGAPFEKLESKTYDGLKIEPIYPRAQGASPIVGRAAATPWQIMQRVDHPDAAKANEQALHDLENGATGLEIEFVGGPGARGFGVTDASPATLKQLFDGIILDEDHRSPIGRGEVANVVLELRIIGVCRDLPGELGDRAIGVQALEPS